jgi:hypothetical protein
MIYGKILQQRRICHETSKENIYTSENELER